MADSYSGGFLRDSGGKLVVAGLAQRFAGSSSDVATMPRQVQTTTIGTVTSGQPVAARAVANEAGTFTQIRFATGATAPSGTYTDCRAGVWSSDGLTKLSETANSVAIVTAANTVYTLTLLTPVTLSRGDEVFLGLGLIATTMPTIRGAAILAAVTALEPPLGRSVSGWTTGSVLPVLNATVGTLPWVELVP